MAAYPVYPIQSSWTSGGYATLGSLIMTTGATTTTGHIYPTATARFTPKRGPLDWLADEVDSICALAREVSA
jgi:hypothetical protein